MTRNTLISKVASILNSFVVIGLLLMFIYDAEMYTYLCYSILLERLDLIS